jgi:hypothetical protein
VLIGAPRKGEPRFGAAYDFAVSGTTWREKAQVTNPGCASGDEFGSAVALSGRTAIIGAELKHKNDAGAVYVLRIT